MPEPWLAHLPHGFRCGKSCGSALRHGIFEGDSGPAPDTPLTMRFHDVLFDGPAYRTQYAQGSSRPPAADHAGLCRHGERDRPDRLPAVADLGTGRFKRSGTVADEHRRHPFQRSDSAESVEGAVQPIDRIFLSISAHHDSLAPDARVRTIYPRYLEEAATPGKDGLTMRAFRDGSPYGNEDLFFASTPNIHARCTRDAATPGMCLSERRIEGADLTFRFPRSWLENWREVADAMDRLTQQLHGAGG